MHTSIWYSIGRLSSVYELKSSFPVSVNFILYLLSLILGSIYFFFKNWTKASSIISGLYVEKNSVLLSNTYS